MPTRLTVPFLMFKPCFQFVSSMLDMRQQVVTECMRRCLRELATETVMETQVVKRWYLDGEPVGSMADFLTFNSFSPEERNAIIKMQPGEAMHLGGGAWAQLVLVCLADEAQR